MSRWKNIWKPRSLVVIFADFQQDFVEFRAGKFSVSDATPIETQLFDSVEEIIKNFGSSKAYHLHLSGSGILSRKIAESPSFHQDLIINGDPSDFLFTEYTDGNTVAVSFCRSSLYAFIMTSLEEAKAHVYGISCGWTPILGILEDESVTLGMRMGMKQGLIAAFDREDKPRSKAMWRGDSYHFHQLMGVAIAHAIPATESPLVTTGWEDRGAKQENFEQFSRFNAFGIGAVGTIFLALIINYFYINHLNQNIAQLESDLSTHNENLSLLEGLKEEQKRKEQLIASAGVNSRHFLAFYLDKIGKSVPKDITLSEMFLFPVEGKLKDKQKVEVNQEKIRVAGSTKGNEILDDWMEAIDRLKWVHSVELINYLTSEDQAEFELEIVLVP